MGYNYAYIVPERFLRNEKGVIKEKLHEFFIASNFEKNDECIYVEKVEFGWQKEFDFRELSIKEIDHNIFIAGPGSTPVFFCPKCENDLCNILNEVLDQLNLSDLINCPLCNKRINPHNIVYLNTDQEAADYAFSDIAIHLSHVINDLDLNFLREISSIFQAPIKIVHGRV